MLCRWRLPCWHFTICPDKRYSLKRYREMKGRKENGHNNARRFEGGVLQMKYVEILHQTAMCMLFVCCGCAPFETVTDEQFASQMVEFKQETLDYTYYVGSSDADDYFIHRGRWNDRKYKLKRNVLLFDFERIDLTHEERKWIRIGLSRRANCYVVKKWEMIGFDDIWLLCDGVAPLNKSH